MEKTMETKEQLLVNGVDVTAFNETVKAIHVASPSGIKAVVEQCGDGHQYQCQP